MSANSLSGPAYHRETCFRPVSGSGDCDEQHGIAPSTPQLVSSQIMARLKTQHWRMPWYDSLSWPRTSYQSFSS